MISKKAQIGQNVEIGQYVVVKDNVIIEDHVKIGDFCILDEGPSIDSSKPLIVGEHSHIRSHSVIYHSTEIGPDLQTGHYVLIREKSLIGEGFRIGSHSDVEGDCIIGEHVSCHSYVHIGKHSKIGSFVWLYSLVTLTNDPLPPSHIEKGVIIEDGVVVCPASVIYPGTHLKIGSYVATGSLVRGVVEKGVIVQGSEGAIQGKVTMLAHLETNTWHPWMRHFKDRYPKEKHSNIDNILKQIEKLV